MSASDSTEGRGSDAPVRVLIVDDSAYNRQSIASMLEADREIEVVGRANNGKEALKQVFMLEPDLITLDLEMPEMDGFSFLRLLMNKRPTPVLVISGYSRRENVFRALELGALDFIAKPGRGISPDIHDIQDELRQKISMLRRLKKIRIRGFEGRTSIASPRERRTGKGLTMDRSFPPGGGRESSSGSEPRRGASRDPTAGLSLSHRPRGSRLYRAAYARSLYRSLCQSPEPRAGLFGERSRGRAGGGGGDGLCHSGIEGHRDLTRLTGNTSDPSHGIEPEPDFADTIG